MQLFRSRLLLWPTTLLGLVCFLGAEQPRPLLYDGKTFEEWREKVRTELKPELRAECIKAVIALGMNGRATDAAEIIIDLVGQYDPNDEDAKPIGDAAERMGKLGRPVIPLLLAALGSDKPAARDLARAVLIPLYSSSMPRGLSEGLAAEMPRLLQTAHSEDAELVSDMLKIIRRINEKAPETAALVVDLLLSRNPKIRQVGLVALPREGTIEGVEIEAQKVIPILIRLLEDEESVWSAIDSLKRYKAAAKDAVPVLSRLLKAGKITGSVESDAYELLERIGPAAKEAFPLLQQKWAGYKKAGEGDNRRTLEWAMRQIDAVEAERILGPAPKFLDARPQ
jgi:hypothetical protein